MMAGRFSKASLGSENLLPGVAALVEHYMLTAILPMRIIASTFSVDIPCAQPSIHRRFLRTFSSGLAYALSLPTSSRNSRSFDRGALSRQMG
jgi:hypothetical protein